MNQMKTILKYGISILIVLLTISASAQIGNLRNAGRRVLEQATGEKTIEAEEKATEEISGKTTGDDGKQGISLDDESFNIVFSNTPIDPLNPGVSTKRFTTDDHIYAVAYLPKTIKDYYQNVKPDARLNVEVFLYSVKISPYEWIKEPVKEQLVFSNMVISGDLINNKYLVIDLLPDPGNTNAYGTDVVSYKKFGPKFEGPVAFAENLSQKLEPGENVIEVLVKCYYQDVASARLMITGDDFSVYDGLSVKLNELASGADTKNARLPKAERNDPAMEKQMIAAVKSSNAWSNKRLDATDILRVNIYNADWHIRRHEISGAILHRYIRAAMAVKTQSGQCAYYIITFQEDYVGGKFQPMKYDGAGDKIMMECENVNK